MDAVLGHRPATRSSVVLDTSEQPDDEGGSEDGEEGKGSAEQSNLSTTIHLEDDMHYHLPQAHLIKMLSLQAVKETYKR